MQYVYESLLNKFDESIFFISSSMKKVLIVESPAKAKKIQKFFDDGTICIASIGHIRDLDQKSLSIDIERDFEPAYVVSPDKQKTVRSIQNYAKSCDIILAADDDREGDAIAWHCGQVANLDFSQNNRIIFHQITHSAIHKALNNIHPLNLNSVNAQQARRVIDRLVGYSLSPLLWKHIQTHQKGLSAGRVQSSLLSILKSHEDTITEFKASTDLSCKGDFTFDDTNISGSSEATFYPKDAYEPQELLRSFSHNRMFRIAHQGAKDEKKYSPKPLITSTLQQCSQKEFGYSVKHTMNIAQKLYENGKITYMRTDSPTISPEFQGQLCSHIGETWSPEYYQPSITGKKVKGAQEAHECIRVTNLDERLNDKYSEQDRRLYYLIKRYTITSHMIPATYNVLTITLTTEETHAMGNFRVTNKVLTSKGYLIYYDGTDKEYHISEQINIHPRTEFELQTSRCLYEPEKPPTYYDESAIVRKLESSGIGRPSTYASIIGTVYSRNYTEVKTIPPIEYSTESITLQKDDEIVMTKDVLKTRPQKNKIVLTELGKQVLVYLLAHFSHILTISFTSQVEEDLDRIHRGEIEWQIIVKKVYDSFITEVTVQKALKSQKYQNKPNQSSGVKSKELGEYQGSHVILKVGPYGPYLSHKDKSKTLKYFLQKSDKSVEDIVLDDVLDIIRYPLTLGKHGGKDVIIQVGPHGKYLKYGKKNYRIPQKDTHTIEECVLLIK